MEMKKYIAVGERIFQGLTEDDIIQIESAIELAQDNYITEKDVNDIIDRILAKYTKIVE